MNDQQQFEISKTNFITTTYNHQGSTFQAIMQSTPNMPKEIVTVNPIMKVEPIITEYNKSIKNEPKQELQLFTNIKSDSVVIKKSRGHIDRYNGMSEEEVMQRKLPDYLRENLDLIVVGINPSMTSACVGHHYAGIGNHFWTCITEAGLVPEQVTCYDDYRMVDYGIGFTNVCSRPTKGAAEISRKEMKAGALIMLEKMRKYKPRLAVFNGKGIYEAFIGHKNFYMGKQPKSLDGTDIMVFVMPSSSARCAQLPRAEDKLPFFVALRKIRDYVRGELTFLNEEEVIFSDYTEFRVTQPDPKSLRKAERRRKRKAEQMLGSGCNEIVLPGKPRKTKNIYSNERLIQRSDSHPQNHVTSGTKDSVDMNISSADLTPVTLTDESVPHLEMPMALYNQSTGVISLVSSSDFSGNFIGNNTFTLGNGTQMIMVPSGNGNNKANTVVQNKNIVSKPIIIQQDANGQAFILATPSQFMQASPHQLQQTNQTTTLMPMNASVNGNTTMAILQPSGQLIATSGQMIDTGNGNATLAWAPQVQQQQQPQQQTQYITTQTSNGMVYQKAALNNSNNQQQSAPQIICTAATLQQLLQQQQQQQQQQQFQILNQLGYPQQFAIQAPIGLGNGIQLQCIGDQMTVNTSDGDLHLTASSANNPGLSPTSHNGNLQSSSTHNMILVSAQPSQQSQPQFAYLSSPSSSQHIVIPITGGTNSILQSCINQQQQQQHQPQLLQIQSNNSQCHSRPMTSSSSNSGISSVAGQGDLDLLSSSTSQGVLDSTGGQMYQQHCNSATPVQMADCEEDQLVHCSSSDEKLIYSAL